MESPTLYATGLDVSLLPATIYHPRTPLLFSETGSIANPDGPADPCHIIVNLGGISLLAIDSYEICYFGSIFDIKLISHGENSLLIDDPDVRVCIAGEHLDDAVSWLVAARTRLLSDSNPIELLAFPTAPKTFSLTVTPQTEYIYRCFQHRSLPDARFVALFAGRVEFLEIDGSFGAPADLKCISAPLLRAGAVSEVVLRGFWPDQVCRLARFLLKYFECLRAITLADFDSLSPRQLELPRLKLGMASYSLSFVRCQLSEDAAAELIGEIAGFPGALVRLALSGFRVTGAMMAQLFDSAGCKTLEFLEIEGGLEVVAAWGFLEQLSVSGGAFGVFPVTELDLIGVDVSLPVSFEMPARLHLLNVSRSTFSATSLEQLLRVLARANQPLSLVLADIKMDDWRAFGKSVIGLPKLMDLQELDWSGNPFGDEIAAYFLSPGRLKFIAVDRIFNPETIAALGIALVSAGGLIGVSIGGSEDSNFSGNLVGLLLALEPLPGLSILHLDNQKLSDADADLLIGFISAHPGIVEVSCDGTVLSSRDDFLAFYGRLQELGTLLTIGRPVGDLRRLGISDVELGRGSVTSATVRAFYYTSFSFTGTWSHLWEFGSRFPFQSKASFPSIASLRTQNPKQTVGEAQQACTSAWTIPVPISPPSATFSYKVAIDGLNPLLFRPFLKETITSSGLTYQRLGFFLDSECINAYVCGRPSDDAAYYKQSLGVLRLWDPSESARWHAAIPRDCLVVVLATDAQADAARQATAELGLSVVEVPALSASHILCELHKFVLAVHRHAGTLNSQQYRPGSEVEEEQPAPWVGDLQPTELVDFDLPDVFAAPPLPDIPVVEPGGGDFCLTCGPSAFHAEPAALLSCCSLFVEDERMLLAGQYLVRTPAAADVFGEFVKAIAGEPYDVNEDTVERLEELAWEFGFVGLAVECGEFAKGIEGMTSREQRYVRIVSDCRGGLNAMNAEIEGLQAEFRVMQQELARLRTVIMSK
jgi:hypothetical protein